MLERYNIFYSLIKLCGSQVVLHVAAHNINVYFSLQKNKVMFKNDQDISNFKKQLEKFGVSL